jgi:tetratricopeptide (TPR) repeat protein
MLTVPLSIQLLAVPVYAAGSPTADVARDLTSVNFDDLVRQGRAAYLASDLNRAESAYNQACPADLVSTYPVARAVTCDNLLASVDEARGNLALAEQRFLSAVAAAEKAGPAYQSLYCAKLIDLGEHYRREGRTVDAEASLLKAVDLARRLTKAKPELLPEALIRLGGLYSDSAQPERGRAPVEEALAIIAAPGDQPKPPAIEIALAHNALGMIDLSAGRQPEAESRLRESVALATGALGEDHPVTAAYQTNLALTLLVEGQFDRAGLLLRRAQFVVESNRNPPGSELAVIYAEMSAVDASEGRMTQAEDYARRAISILSVQQRPNPRAVSIAQVTLGGIYLRSHDTAAAEHVLPQAVQIQRETAVNPRTLAASVQLLGELRAQQHNWPEAEALDREAISLYEKAGNTNPAVAPLLLALADVLKHEGGSKQEVRILENQAHTILRSASQSTPRV